MQPTHTILHEHRFGATTYTVSSPHEPNAEEVIKACKIDFDDERDDLGILNIEIHGIVKIPARKKKKKGKK